MLCLRSQSVTEISKIYLTWYFFSDYAAKSKIGKLCYQVKYLVRYTLLTWEYVHKEELVKKSPFHSLPYKKCLLYSLPVALNMLDPRAWLRFLLFALVLSSFTKTVLFSLKRCLKISTTECLGESRCYFDKDLNSAIKLPRFGNLQIHWSLDY